MLQVSVDWFMYSLLGIDPDLKWAGFLNFFIYDTVKIIFLIFAMVFLAGFLRTFLPPHKVREWLAKSKGLGYVAASLFGSVTPFCSCSSIPIFLSFLEVGIPVGVAFSFLITSPLINEYLLVLMLGFFGWKITFFYILSGLIIGIVSGIIINNSGLERYLIRDLTAGKTIKREFPEYERARDRFVFGLREARGVVKRIWLWILVGVGIGSLIHNYVPQQAIQNIIFRTGFFSVPLAVILGVPMYGTCAAIVPVAVVLFKKGIPLGTALAFMMATAALSLPEAVMLRRAMKLKLIFIFFGIATAGIIFTGYLFNLLEKILAV
ncbi:MAG: permease [Candidatus Omnitrophica bacterium]|nr:permease [Candidatus Omnitrophota bacterium]MBD3269503.1 permease [Candidatus Omnitrophota bacterium]